MHNNLTIDCGNTAIKAVIWEGKRAVWRHTFQEFSYTDAQAIVERYAPKKAIGCSVADPNHPLRQILIETFGDDNVIWLSNKTPMPIKIGYATPDTLGVDRIAAVAGAVALCPGKNLLVVDIGTAATYDVVTENGEFIGGNIAPGVGMRLKALHNFTARLPMIESSGETPLFGTSTETAMRSGAVNGIAAEIMYYYSKLPEGTRLIITGGWGNDIAELIPVKAIVKPCLVSIGLNSILMYNETK
ncbi:MAG: type III pantothenate kinase [Bacteroides sp.]|nr:type III pantothenate kinase [Bacteroides sp.]